MCSPKCPLTLTLKLVLKKPHQLFYFTTQEHEITILCDLILAVHVHCIDVGEAMTWNVLHQHKDDDKSI